MGCTLRWILLVVALSGPAVAQNGPSQQSVTNANPLMAFGKAFLITRHVYIEPLSTKSLLVRALHGLATAPMLASPEQKRIIAAASAQLDATASEDGTVLMLNFGNTLDALHATADGPPLDGMLRAAIAGMLGGLDTQTRFLPPAPASNTAGEAGAGLRLAVSAVGLRVVRVYSHTPAAQAGVRQGDEVVSINGRLTKNVPLDEAVTLLRGPVGSPVTLLIRRDATSTPVTVELTRAVIRIPLISSQTIGSIAYLHVEAFAPGAAQALRRELSALQSRAVSPISGVILDLRDNAGGRLTEAVETADELLPPATLIATVTGRQESDNKRFTASTGDIVAGLPMVVLMNEVTGAGSELVAAALQKGRGAVLLGRHTAGAGLVATVFPLPPLGAMSLTTQHITLASGQVLKPPGLLPQVALMPRKGEASNASDLEAPSDDPVIVRLRRGIPQSPQPGTLFDAPDMPEQDFEVRQACAAIAMLPPGPSSHP